MSSPELQFKALRGAAYKMMLAAFFSGLPQTGCLQLNADYIYPSFMESSGEGADQLETVQLTPGELTTAPVTTSSSTPDVIDVALTITASGFSSGSATSSSTLSTSNSQSSISSSSTNSTTSTTGPQASEPGSGSRWIPITVHNPSNSRIALSGTSIALAFDHAALVTGGTRPDGEDLRVYSVRGAVRTQLHRVLDPESNWGRSDTKIWFKLDTSLNASQSETTVYHLVTDANTSSPAQDPNEVFLLFDDFNLDNPSFDGWTFEESGVGGDFDKSISGGQLVISASATNNTVVRNIVRSAENISVPGIAIEASVGWDEVPGSDGCTEETVIGMWSPTTFHKRALWNRRDDEWYFSNRSSSGSDRYQLMSAKPVDGNLRRHKAYWVENPVAMYTDEQFAANMTPALTGFTSPNDGPLQIGFGVGADGALCSRTSRVTVDWVYARLVNSVFDVETTPRFADAFVQP